MRTVLTKNHWVRWMGLMGCLFGLTGCAMQQSHYNSMVDLQQESMNNLSYQILDAIVAILDRGEIPNFFYVEEGQSNWGGGYNASVGASIQPRWSADSTTLSPGVGGSESLGLTWQINDLGPASMTRVTSIYEYLCYPLHIGDQENGFLPHGALYTIVEESDRPEGFILKVKRKNGRYLGVTEKTLHEYYNFMQDIIYWSRHSSPEPGDLLSTVGGIYAFVVDYLSREVALTDAVAAVDLYKQDYDESQKNLDNANQRIQELESALPAQAKDSERVQSTMLANAYQQREYYQTKAQQDLETYRQKQYDQEIAERDMEILLDRFLAALETIQVMDPDVNRDAVTMIFAPFEQRVEAILKRDNKLMEEIEYHLPTSAGIKARDSFDKIYRDRFEALPQRFDGAYQMQ